MIISKYPQDRKLQIVFEVLAVEQLKQLMQLISEHSTAIEAVTAVVTALVAVIGIFLTRSSIRASTESYRQ